MKLDDRNSDLMEKLLLINDYRNPRGKRYRFCDLLLLCLYGLLAGKTTAVDIQFYICLNFDYFNKLIGLESVPSHDTISRVIRFTNFEKLSEVLNEWLDSYYPELCTKYGKFRVLHIDGKASRAAAEKSNGEKSIYLLNAMYEGGTIMLLTTKVGEKENEISCLPDFLDLINLNDTIVTIDAMGCNNTIIPAIIKRGGNYLTTVKENQGNLFNEIAEECKKIENKKMNDEITKKEINEFKTLENCTITEKNHGRIDTYSMTLLKDTSFLFEEFKSKSFYGTIGKIGILDKITEAKEKGKWVKTTSRSYIICSLEDINAKDMLEIKRNHWNIEMQHWILDVHLNEDRSTARKDNAIINSSILKRFAMRLKKQSGELNKLTVGRFGMYCAHDCENITKILFAEIT